MIMTLTSNAEMFSRPLFSIFGFTVRYHGKKLTNNPHPPYTAVKNRFRLTFSLHNNMSGCKPLSVLGYALSTDKRDHKKK